MQIGRARFSFVRPSFPSGGGNVVRNAAFGAVDVAEAVLLGMFPDAERLHGPEAHVQGEFCE